MKLKWFDATEATKFGELLAKALIERTPLEEAVEEKIVSKKHEQMTHLLAQHIERFKTKHTLNVYQKAKLGSAFKFTLVDKGYESAYINNLTKWLMLRL